MKKYLLILAFAFLALPDFAHASFLDLANAPHDLPYTTTVSGQSVTFEKILALRNNTGNSIFVYYSYSNDPSFVKYDGQFAWFEWENVNKWAIQVTCTSTNSCGADVAKDLQATTPFRTAAGAAEPGACFDSPTNFRSNRDIFLKATWDFDTASNVGTVFHHCIRNQYAKSPSFVTVPSRNFDNSTFGSINTINDSYLNRPNSEGYVDVPNLATDPAGFVYALLTNMGIWMKNLVVPPDDFFSSRWNDIKSVADSKFPIVSQVQSALATTTSTNAVIAISGLHLGSASVPSITVFDPVKIYQTYPTQVEILKLIIRTVLWFTVGMALLNKSKMLFIH